MTIDKNILSLIINEEKAKARKKEEEYGCPVYLELPVSEYEPAQEEVADESSTVIVMDI